LCVCKSEHQDFKRDYAKEKLKENMGQSVSKERDFKSKVLKIEKTSKVKEDLLE
jgi:hypothetical protein